MRRLRILVVDDHPLMVEAICLALEKNEGFEVVGAATSGAEIVSLVRSTTPDVVLLDMRMPAVDCPRRAPKPFERQAWTRR